MSMFDIFLDGQSKKFKGTIITKDKTISHGRITDVDLSDGDSFDCFFYRQGMSRMNLGQTFKTDVSAYAITSPGRISISDFTKDCRLRIEQENKFDVNIYDGEGKVTYTGDGYDDIGDFDVIYAEDVGGMGVIIQVGLKQVI